MKKNDIPQDCGMYEGGRAVNYASNENGQLEPTLTSGWDAANTANTLFHESIHKQREAVLQRIHAGECSSLAYHMTDAKMDVDLLCSYTGFSRKNVKRHLLREFWEKLSDKKRRIYADLFELTIDELNSTPTFREKS